MCFLFSINTVSYAANISSRKASNPVIQSMNDKYHVDFSGMSIDELNKFIDKMKDEDQTRASGNLLNNTQLARLTLTVAIKSQPPMTWTIRRFMRFSLIVLHTHRLWRA